MSAGDFYAREAGRMSRELGAARGEANALRALLNEADGVLRAMPFDAVRHPLLQRINAALAGNFTPQRETLDETVDRLASLGGTRI